MSRKAARHRAKKRCDNCSRLSPPDSKNCLHCKRVFVSSPRHPAASNSEPPPENSDSFFNETEINLLLTLGNLAVANDKNLAKSSITPKTGGSKKADAWGNYSLPMTRIPLVIHKKREVKSKRKYIPVIIALITTVFVSLLYIFLTRVKF